MFMTTALRFLVLVGAVDGACFGFLHRRGPASLPALASAQEGPGLAVIVNPRTIKVTTLGGDATEVPVVAGQTVRDFKSRADLRATLGPQISLIRLINNNGDHVLQDHGGLDGVTDVTALRDFTVARNELRHTIEENDADWFQVKEMGEDIIIRKAPAGARTRNEARPLDVPLYHMFNRNNEDLVLAEFGFLEGFRKLPPYFYTWPGNWTSENVGAVDFKLWEDFIPSLLYHHSCI